MTPLSRAIRVVPPKVRLKIALVVVLVPVVLGAPLYWLSQRPLWLATVLLPTLGFIAYEVWCRWPRLRLAIPRTALADAPVVAGQRVRLTFDDGPTEGVTERVLDLLHTHGIKASFFLLVPKARTHPALVRRMIADGHVVGLHGADHRFPFGRSIEDLAASLGGAQRELAAIAGVPITLYRPSHGFKNRALVAAVTQLGLQLCFWDYGVWDTDAPPPDELVARLTACVPTDAQEAPPVVLLHDGLGDDPTVPTHATPMLAALAAWLPTLPTIARG